MTLVEAIVGIALTGIIGLTLALSYQQMQKVIIQTKVKSELMRNARAAVQVPARFLQAADGASIVITRQNSSQPNYSKISFTITHDTDVVNHQIYQLGDKLYHVTGTKTTLLATSVKTAGFTFPNFPTNMSALDVAASISVTSSGQEHVLSLNQTVYLLNPAEQNNYTGI